MADVPQVPNTEQLQGAIDSIYEQLCVIADALSLPRPPGPK